MDCSSLTTVTIPDFVTNISKKTFMNCTNLTSVTIGKGVEAIFSEAFCNCSELTNVYCYSNYVPGTIFYYQGELNENVFKGSFIEYATLHVPASLVNNYKTIEPWKNFKNIVALEGSEMQKCAKPTISYQRGKLIFKSETEGAEFVSEITDIDIQIHYDSEIQLGVTYNISVYATKPNYDDSNVATATLCWIDVEPKTEGITNDVANIPANAVLIQTENGQISISGADDGTAISVFGTNGLQVGSAVSRNGQAVINTHLPSGNIAIVKIGNRSVKVAVK